MVEIQSILGALGLAASVLAGAGCSGARELRDLGTTEDFRARFNSDAGKPRLLLLLSPT